MCGQIGQDDGWASFLQYFTHIFYDEMIPELVFRKLLDGLRIILFIINARKGVKRGTSSRVLFALILGGSMQQMETIKELID